MAARVQEDMALYEALDSEKGNFNQLFQEITDYVLPYHSTVNNRPVFSGQRRGVTRYSSAAPDNAEKLASMLGTTLTNPAMRWLDIGTTDTEVSDLPEVSDWLEEVRETTLEEMADTNFYQEIDVSWLSLVGYGTNAMYIEEEFKDGKFIGPVYEALPIREYVFTVDSKGLLDTLFRCFELTANQAENMFSTRAGFRSFGQRMTELLNNTDPKRRDIDKFKILHKIGPRHGRRAESLRSDQMPFESVYYDCQDKHIILESGFQEQPANVGRWRKNADDRGWGRGPGLNAMPDVRTLNEQERLMLKALNKDIDPPWWMENKGVIGSVRTMPSGLTFGKRGAQPPMPLLSGARHDFAQLELERREMKVAKMFLVDQLEKLVGDPTPNMTAFEFGKRMDLMRQMLGSTFGRIQKEMLDPTVIRTYRILERNGRYPPPPQTLAQSGARLDIKYIGPLARAQRAGEADSIQRGYEFAAFVAQSTGRTDALMVLDDVKAQRHINELLGVPSGIQRDDEEIGEIKAAEQAAMEEQAQMDQMGQVAEAVGKVA